MQVMFSNILEIIDIKRH